MKVFILTSIVPLNFADSSTQEKLEEVLYAGEVYDCLGKAERAMRDDETRSFVRVNDGAVGEWRYADDAGGIHLIREVELH